MRASASCKRRRLTGLLHRREPGSQWRFTDFSIGAKCGGCVGNRTPAVPALVGSFALMLLRLLTVHVRSSGSTPMTGVLKEWETLRLLCLPLLQGNCLAGRSCVSRILTFLTGVRHGILQRTPSYCIIPLKAKTGRLNHRTWCVERDSNSQSFRHWLLRPACIPFHHRRITRMNYTFFGRTSHRALCSPHNI